MDVKTSLQKALVDQESSQLFPSAEKIETIKDLVNALHSINLGAAALCHRGVDISKADAIFELMLSELDDDDETGLLSRRLDTAKVYWQFTEKKDYWQKLLKFSVWWY